jgi:hypothetical protein
MISFFATGLPPRSVTLRRPTAGAERSKYMTGSLPGHVP